MDLHQKIWLGFNLMIALGGTLFLYIAWNAWNDRYQIVRNGIQTKGLVIETVHRPTKGLQKKTTALAPVVQFMTQDGQLIKYYSQTYTTPVAHSPGETVDIWYLPDQPQKATMDGLDAWVLPIVFGIFGSVMCLIGYSGLIRIGIKNSFFIHE